MSEYYRPLTSAEVSDILREKPQSVIIAGGTDLMIRRKNSFADKKICVDVTWCEELQQIYVKKGFLYIGAAVTFEQLEHHELIRKYVPILAKAASLVGSPQIRHAGTIGGNICNASAAADSVPCLVALDAELEIQSFYGCRRIKMKDFLQDDGKSTLQKGELLVSLRIPMQETDTRMGFDKIGRRKALAISRMNGACILKTEEEMIREARICIGAVTRKAERCREAEIILSGQKADMQLFAEAGYAVREWILKKTGIRPSSEYKLPVAAEFTKRLLQNTYLQIN